MPLEISTFFNFQARHPSRFYWASSARPLRVMMSVWQCSSNSTSNIRKSKLRRVSRANWKWCSHLWWVRAVWYVTQRIIKSLDWQWIKHLPSLQDVYTQLDAKVLKFATSFSLCGGTSNRVWHCRPIVHKQWRLWYENHRASFFDALLFETYKFRTITIIGDGASWN